MIRHIVALRFRSDVTDQTKAEIADSLNNLRSTLPGIEDFFCSKNVSPERELVREHNDIFWFDFVDSASRDLYLAADEHRVIGDRIVGLLEGGTDGVFVIDVELP